MYHLRRIFQIRQVVHYNTAINFFTLTSLVKQGNSVRILLACFLMVFATTFMVAADDEPQPVVLTETVPASFGKVWTSIKEVMTEFGCPKPQTEKVTEPIEETGLYKGLYISDYCILAQGEDSTRDKMEVFGELPRIRGGIWITGRVQYRINVKEESARNTKIILKAELSGFEEFITNQVHFWVSNGVLEKRMMDLIIKRVQEKSANNAADDADGE